MEKVSKGLIVLAGTLLRKKFASEIKEMHEWNVGYERDKKKHEKSKEKFQQNEKCKTPAMTRVLFPRRGSVASLIRSANVAVYLRSLHIIHYHSFMKNLVNSFEVGLHPRQKSILTAHIWVRYTVEALKITIAKKPPFLTSASDL